METPEDALREDRPFSPDRCEGQAEGMSRGCARAPPPMCPTLVTKMAVPTADTGDSKAVPFWPQASEGGLNASLGKNRKAQRQRGEDRKERQRDNQGVELGRTKGFWFSRVPGPAEHAWLKPALSHTRFVT